MARNPNPQRITAAGWWFMEQLLALERGTVNGGIYANKSGYHNTRTSNNRQWPGNYSVVDKTDKKGPPDKAAAYDWTFRDAQAQDYDTIIKYTNRLLKSAKDMDDPRLNGWREFYGQADADRQVEGWDTRYLRAATSDPSHLWHLHFSESREFVESRENKESMLSVLRGETVKQWREGGGVSADDVVEGLAKDGQLDTKKMGYSDEYVKDNPTWAFTTGMEIAVRDSRATRAMIDTEATASRLRDEAILRAIEGLDTDAILDAINDRAAEEVQRDNALRELVDGFGSGQLNAEQVATRVVQIMGTRLSE